ncbi:hypothetical protein [Enterococcus sp. AZ072]|uniref:hypothetical protein n=1 Tax=unclassified Enterococcus TaxID=2608891 RepID=UPI003D2A87C5
MEKRNSAKRRIYSQLLGKSLILLAAATIYFYVIDPSSFIENLKNCWIIILLLLILYSAVAVDQLTRINSFQRSLWLGDEHFSEDKLVISIVNGQIVLEKDYLSNFVEFITKDDYILRIPAFDWVITIRKTLVPMQLKAGYTKSFGRRVRLADSDKKFLFKQAKKERKNQIVFFIALQVIAIILYVSSTTIAAMNSSDETNSFLFLFITVLSCVVAIWFSKTIISLVLTQSTGHSLGLPRINSEYYEYQIKGMTVKMLKDSVDIRYDDRERVLITTIGEYKYIERFKMKDFNVFMDSLV